MPRKKSTVKAVEVPSLGIRLVWPTTAPITQYFGENPEIYSRWGYPGHNGLDFGLVNGPVMCAANGRILLVGFEDGGYGNYVKVQHDGGILTYYAHLKNAPVRAGQVVKAGEVIATSDNTGFSTGPHLHFGLKLPGTNPGYKGYVDPLPYLSGVMPDEPAVEPPVIEIQQYPGAVELSGNWAVVSEWLNVRSGPGTGYPIVGKLNGGDVVSGQRLHSQSMWVEFGDGKFAAISHAGTPYMELTMEEADSDGG